jgi:dTDP-4-dehydrorhamnose 3,5-epimerase
MKFSGIKTSLLMLLCAVFAWENPMKILNVKSLAMPDIKVIQFGRFPDSRGFFAEHYRKSDFANLDFINGIEFSQCNESYSRPGTIRGLHFQWNPYMGKLVRTLSGHMTDLALDIRKGSPTFGKIIGYDMPADPSLDFGEWIWIPPGFAHGNFFRQESQIEYFCSSEYSPGCEACISPFAPDIDWFLFDPELKKQFDAIVAGKPLITDKDRNGYSLASWSQSPISGQFVFE